MPLTPCPRIVLTVLEDRVASEPGFLTLKRPRLLARYPSGNESEAFTYDHVTRRALDAAVMAAHFLLNGERRVFLRSAVRPPLALRSITPLHNGSEWELPAGLIEPGESAAEAAAREIAEELGLEVKASQLRELGGWTFPAPGVIGEQHVYFHIEVDPATCTKPSEDGSPLEREALVTHIALAEAIALCRAGAIRDAKTELGLRRLAEIV